MAVRLTREQIIEAARPLFARHGLKKTSLSDIARRLGVTKAALYYHFPGGKVEIADAALAEEEAKVLEAMRRAVEGERDPRRQLRALLLARVAHLEELRQVLEVTGEVADEFAELYERSERRFNQEEQAMLEAILRRGQREGLFRRANVRRLARGLQTALRRVHVDLVYHREEDEDPERAADEMLDLLLYGIAEPASRGRGRRG
ncbi:MAG: TetR family transcriptional regulator [Acidobacteria bacterium]|nr:MAG: TetR family transcriptional regulator [Acidobacteriota bacterium]